MRKLKILAGAVLMAASAASTAHADQVINDDLIVTFSACIGNDCVNGENFGFDTLRLKENNLRIHFNDTSTSASFPTRDWRIVANDSANGGSEYLAIEDADAGTQPFRVDAGAGNNALRVENGGFVGFGTSNPAVNLHVVEGNTPTLRLEQDGSSGFTPQIYDVAANESNFFIRDVTNGSRLFFRAQPGAPENSIYIASSGFVGVGTNNPDENLSIRSSTNRSAMQFESSASSDHLQILWNGTETRFANENAGVIAFRFQPNGDGEFAGTVTTGSTCLQMDALACTFSDGAGASCSVGTCP